MSTLYLNNNKIKCLVPERGVTGGDEKTSKRLKAKQKPKKNRKRNKNYKTKNDSDFDTRLVGSNLYFK